MDSRCATSGGMRYLERGEYGPSLMLALQMADYFEVPVEVLFSLEPFPRIGGPEGFFVRAEESGVRMGACRPTSAPLLPPRLSAT